MSGMSDNAPEREEQDVAGVEEIPVGGMKGVEVHGRPYVIFNLDGEFHAYRDQCPHQGAKMSCGTITGAMLPREPGEDYVYGEEGRVITCPRHHWKYEIATGHSLFATDRRRLVPLPVRVADGRVLLSVRPQPVAAGSDQVAAGDR